MKTPAQFKSDFDLVTQHYALPPSESEEAKAAARRDFEAALTCFPALAEQIRQANTEGTPP